MTGMATLFVSDLHLDPARPAVTALFLDFLERRARRAEALYILGDLFEAWIGDDDDAELGETVAAALRALTLCIDDVEYQTFRTRVRDPVWQAGMLALPVERRRALAGQLRETSRQVTQRKAAEITDVNLAEVDRVMRASGVRRLIHGHTHRPAIHERLLDGQSVRRAVLSDWHDHRGSALRCDAAVWRLEPFPPPGA